MGILSAHGSPHILRPVQREGRTAENQRLEEDVQGQCQRDVTKILQWRTDRRQKALEDAQTRKVQAADRMQQRYKELEEAKQARRVVLVDKVTMPTKGKAARGRQGGMVTVRAGQPRRELLFHPHQRHLTSYLPISGVCRFRICGPQGHLRQSARRSTKSQSRHDSCCWQIRPSRRQSAGDYRTTSEYSSKNI